MDWTRKICWSPEAQILLAFLKVHDVTRAICQAASDAHFNYGLRVGVSTKCKAHTEFTTGKNLFGTTLTKVEIVLNEGEYWCHSLMHLLQEVCNVATHNDQLAAEAKAKDRIE